MYEGNALRKHIEKIKEKVWKFERKTVIIYVISS